MRIYWTYRNHWRKPIRTLHIGINISGCIESCHYGVSVSLLFITVGVQLYKSQITEQ